MCYIWLSGICSTLSAVVHGTGLTQKTLRVVSMPAGGSSVLLGRIAGMTFTRVMPNIPWKARGSGVVLGEFEGDYWAAGYRFVAAMDHTRALTDARQSMAKPAL